MFGQLFMAMDWKEEINKLNIFDTYRDIEKLPRSQQDRFDLIAAAPSNEYYVLYSPDTHTLIQVYRDKYRDKDNVYEDYLEVDLTSENDFPRHILTMHI